MNPELAAALEKLRDIHLPAEPGWWPPAPGWWMVAIVLTGSIFFLLQRGYRQYRMDRPYRQFNTAIMALSLQPGSVEKDLQSMSALTRRLAITLYGRQRAASLTGAPWLQLLDTLSASTNFTKGPGRILAHGPYQPVTIDQLQPLRNCLLALGRHRRLPSRDGVS